MHGGIDRKYIPSILKRMNLAVCTSKSETFGHVIVEPMFAGIPVVTFDTGAASYLIRDFSNGFVIRNKTERENFRKAVEFLLRNKDAAESMGRNNKKIANQSLTWDATADNTINMYFSIR
jgi:glycosyltransferase involved in cell wall biosynthesis